MRTIAARPTTYNGIQMRSRLEARYAAFLDASGTLWEYEPRAYASAYGQYLPDFLLPPADWRKVPIFVEVRPTVELAMLALDRMTIIWASDRTAYLEVTVPDVPFVYGAIPGSGWMVHPSEPWT